MIKYIYLFLLLLSNNFVNSLNEENYLRNQLFKNYNKNVRPTKLYNNTLNVDIGLAVQNIESFDQIEEKIELNVWLRKYWKNDFLVWDSKLSNITQLTLTDKDAWTPDIELINAATLPDIYTLKGGMYLYPNGQMLWSMPTIYKVSCPLELKYFPFDTQICSLVFSSWSYDNSLLNLNPRGDKNTQLDVLDTFSHSEWKLVDYDIEIYNESRKCCPDKLFNVNKYNFKLKRYTHYYTLNMGMTITLVLVSFIIMMVKPDNLSRTGTAVFIPLTILALELTIAGKIPVVGYYTLMDIFFLTCFITSMIVSIESGIIYTIITSKSKLLYNIFCNVYDFEKLVKKHNDNIKLNKIRNRKHSDEINSINNKLNNNLLTSSNDNDNEFLEMEDILNRNNNLNRNKSYNDVVNSLNQNREDNNLINSDNINEINSDNINEINNDNINEINSDNINEINNDNINEINSDNINEINSDNVIVDKNVVKIIEYNSKDLSLTFKEYLIFNEITNLAYKVDNFCIIILPSIFFIMMCVIFSYE